MTMTTMMTTIMNLPTKSFEGRLEKQPKMKKTSKKNWGRKKKKEKKNKKE